MTLLPPKTREYLLHALTGVPDVYDTLLANIDEESPIWDRVVDPERFTLREMVAHVADWESVWLHRFMRIATEYQPTLPDIDESKVAIDHDYAHTDPAEKIQTFREGRDAFVTYVKSLPLEAWERISFKDGAEYSLQAWLVQIHAHDGYHLQQTAEWITRDRETEYAARD